MDWDARLIDIIVRTSAIDHHVGLLVLFLAAWLVLALLRVRSLGAYLLAALGAFAMLAARQLTFFDDAVIFLRFADNVVAGHGPVFNPGERVEGFTSPLWLGLLALSRLAGLDLLWSMYLLSIGCVIALAFVIIALLKEHGFRGDALVLATVLLLLFTNVAVRLYSATGFGDTLLFAVLVATALWADRRAEARGVLLDPRVALLVGLAWLARPEGALVFGALTLHHVAMSWATRRALQWKRLAVWGAAWLALVVPVEVARKAYYGDWFPNTYYNKTGIVSAYTLNRAIWYLARWFNEPSNVLLATLGTIGAVASIRDREKWKYLFLIGIYGVYWAYIGSDRFHSRFLLPLLPALLLWSAEALRRMGSLLGSPRALAVAAFLLVLPGAVWGYYTPNEPTAYESARLSRLGRYLRDRVPPGTLISGDAAGAIPYFSRLPFVDHYGLVNKTIGRMPVRAPGKPHHEKYDGRYVLRRRPVYIFPGPAIAERGYFPEAGGAKRSAGLKAALASPTGKELVELPGFWELYVWDVVPADFMGALGEQQDVGYFRLRVAPRLVD